MGRRWAVGALLIMTFATGLVDAVSFLRLGHVLVANMTGNVVFLGFSVAHGYGLPVVAPIMAMFAGAATGALLLQVTLAGVVGLAAVLVAGAACLFALAPVADTSAV
nr:DUF1275 domain-containing protein [Streptomyces sp. NBC_00857]